MGFDRALNVRDLVSKSLNDAKPERTAVDCEVDAIVCIGRLDVSRLRRFGSFRFLRGEKRGREEPLGRDPLIRVLLKPGVDRGATWLVLEGPAKRLIGELF